MKHDNAEPVVDAWAVAEVADEVRAPHGRFGALGELISFLMLCLLTASAAS